MTRQVRRRGHLRKVPGSRRKVRIKGCLMKSPKTKGKKNKKRK